LLVDELEAEVFRHEPLKDCLGMEGHETQQMTEAAVACRRRKGRP
jgi:hypothetical protein